jgi:GT2 family glycosyltransferase
VLEYDAPERLQHGPGFLGGGLPRPRVADPGETLECDWVTGCGFLVRADALRAMPGPRGFDERFFLYWEDVDFSRRVAAGGYRVMYEPAAELLHKESAARHARASATKRDSRLFYMIRNEFLFARRHLRGPRRRLVLAHGLLIRLPRTLAGSVVRKRGVDARELALVTRAHLDGVRGREGPRRRRWALLMRSCV